MSNVLRTGCVVLALAASAWGQRQVFNVKASPYSAAGNGTTDDTAAIQAAIDDAVTSVSLRGGKGAVIYFPEGFYRITEMLEVPGSGVSPGYAVDLDLEGAGGFPYDCRPASYPAPSNTPQIPPAALVADWDDAVGDSLLYLNSTAAINIRDIQFYGRKSDKGTRVAHLVSTKSNSGGVVGVTIRNCTFVDCETGLWLGKTSGNGNNSEMIFERISFQSVDTCVKVATHQAVNHVYTMLMAVNCKTILDYTSGGNITVNTATLTACGGTGSTDWMFKFGSGPLNATSTLNQVRIETGGGVLSQEFLQVNGDCNILVTSFNDSNDYANAEDAPSAPLVELGAGNITFINSRFGYASYDSGSPYPLANMVAAFDPNYRKLIRFSSCQFPHTGVKTPPDRTTPAVTDPACSLGIVGVISGTPGYYYYGFDNCSANYYIASPAYYVGQFPLADCATSNHTGTVGGSSYTWHW